MNKKQTYGRLEGCTDISIVKNIVAAKILRLKVYNVLLGNESDITRPESVTIII